MSILPYVLYSLPYVLYSLLLRLLAFIIHRLKAAGELQVGDLLHRLHQALMLVHPLLEYFCLFEA